MGLRDRVESAREQAREAAGGASERFGAPNKAQMAAAAVGAALGLVLGMAVGMGLGKSGSISRATHDAVIADLTDLQETASEMSLSMEALTAERDALAERVAADDVDAGTADERARVLDQRQADLDALESSLEEREESLAALDQPRPTIPGDGTYLVGVDVEPGLYRTQASGDCAWVRRDGVDAASEVLASGGGVGQVYAEVLVGDFAFTATNCGAWQKVE